MCKVIGTDESWFSCIEYDEITNTSEWSVGNTQYLMFWERELWTGSCKFNGKCACREGGKASSIFRWYHKAY